MDFDKINTVIQTISIIFVGITLLITYRQLRESARQTQNLELTLRTSVVQEVTNYQREFWGLFFEDQDLLKWYFESRSIEVRPNPNQNKIVFYTILKLDFYENMFLEHRKGNLSEEVWSTWVRAFCIDMQDQFFISTWGSMEKNKLYADSFIQYVNKSVLKKIPTKAPVAAQ